MRLYLQLFQGPNELRIIFTDPSNICGQEFSHEPFTTGRILMETRICGLWPPVTYSAVIDRQFVDRLQLSGHCDILAREIFMFTDKSKMMNVLVQFHRPAQVTNFRWSHGMSRNLSLNQIKGGLISSYWYQLLCKDSKRPVTSYVYHNKEPILKQYIV